MNHDIPISDMQRIDDINFGDGYSAYGYAVYQDGDYIAVYYYTHCSCYGTSEGLSSSPEIRAPIDEFNKHFIDWEPVGTLFGEDNKRHFEEFKNDVIQCVNNIIAGTKPNRS